MNTFTCDHCNGTGETASTELYRGRRVSTWCRCTQCQGAGTIDAPAQPEPPSEAATVPVMIVAQVESREDAMRRLLVVARECGVQLKRDDRGDLWATSVSGARPAVPGRPGFLRLPRLPGIPPLPARCRLVGAPRLPGRA